jgi:hypothetical protein
MQRAWRWRVGLRRGNTGEELRLLGGLQEAAALVPRFGARTDPERGPGCSRSRADLSPLIAAAVALHVADMELQLAGANELIIY